MKRTRLATPIRAALFKAKRPRSATTDKPDPSTTTPPNGLEKLTEAPTTPITDQTASPGQTMAEAGTAERVTMIPGFTFDPSFVTNNTNALDPTSPTFDPTADYYTCDQSNNIVLAVYPDGSCAITPNKDDANFVVFSTLDEALNDAYNYLSLIPEVEQKTLPMKAMDIPGFVSLGVAEGNEFWQAEAGDVKLRYNDYAGEWYIIGTSDEELGGPFGSLDEVLTDIDNMRFANKIAPHRLTSIQTTHNNNLHYPLVKTMFDE